MSDFIVRCQQALRCMDLTSLQGDESAAQIERLCQQALTPYGNTAAVCIYPQFIATAKAALRQAGGSQVRIATVVNFPQGNADVAAAVAQTRAAIAQGADEVDVVFPWRALLAGDENSGAALVRQCKAACAESGVLLKVILETGELAQASRIRRACEIAILAGADFLKTSSGKVPINATLPAAKIMLQSLRDLKVADRVGFKAAGGVRDARTAADYLDCASHLLGEHWLTPAHFRFGASGLLADLLSTLARSQG